MIRWISLVSTAVTLGALTAHVLELPNKLALEGPLWLAIQQHLYRGWGAVIGPFEVAAMVSTWALVLREGARPTLFRPTLLAAMLLSAALAAFFTLNAPVNAALAAWTPSTLPPGWPAYRLRWEAGHALSFALVLTAFLALLGAFFRAMLARALHQAAWPAGAGPGKGNLPSRRRNDTDGK
jgi:hypothetical protein